MHHQSANKIDGVIQGEPSQLPIPTCRVTRTTQFFKPFDRMKRTSKRSATKTTALLLSAVLWLSVAAPAPAGDSARLFVKVISLVGDARYTTNRASWRTLRVGDELSEGSVIQTAPDKASTVDMQLIGSMAGGQGMVQISSNSILSVIRLDSRQVGAVEVRGINLRLALGRMLMTLDRTSDYNIELLGDKIPMRLTPLRKEAEGQETEFAYSLPGTVRVLKGALNIRTTTEPAKRVSAGEQFRADTGAVTKTPPDARN